MCRFMEGDLDIVGVDIGEGRDWGVKTSFRCWNGDDQERLLDELDPMAHDLGVDVGTLSFSAEVSEHSCDIIRMLFGWSEEFNAQSVALKRLLKTYDEMAEWMERFCSLARKGKSRKTTYKTIRLDCAKRNRHK